MSYCSTVAFRLHLIGAAGFGAPMIGSCVSGGMGIAGRQMPSSGMLAVCLRTPAPHMDSVERNPVEFRRYARLR